MNNFTTRQIHIDLFPYENGFHFEHERPSCDLPSFGKVREFFQKHPFDTLKVCHEGKKGYMHLVLDEIEVFNSKKALKKALSQESGGAWVEEKFSKKRYFVDDSGWFQTSFKQVSKAEFIQRVDSPSTMQKVLGIGLGILALLPGALEIKERLPFGVSEAGMGLLALQHKSPLLGALGYSLLPISVDAQAVGTEFQVNNYTTSNQEKSSIAPLNDGGFVVVWTSGGQDGSMGGIFAKSFGATGALLGPEFQVNNYTASEQNCPAIAPLNNGGFVVAWQSSSQDGDWFGIFAQRYNTSGAIVGSEFQVNNYTTSDQQYPAIAPLNDGGFVVVWESNGQDGSGFGIFAQRYVTSGTIVGSEFQVNSYTASHQQHPAIAPLNDGGFVVAWESTDQDGSGFGIFAQRFDSIGAIVGSEFQVNSYTTNKQQNPAIAPLNDGGFVIAWESEGQDEPIYYGIFAQMYAASGSIVGSEFQVNNYTASSQISPAIAPLNDGGFVVTWTSYGQAGNSNDIFAQRHDPSGTRVGSEFQVNSYTYSSSDQFSSEVAPLNDGGFVISWTSEQQDVSGRGIFGQRYDRNGNPVPVTYVPLMSSSSALSSRSDTTNFPSSHLSLTSSATLGNSAASSSTISSTASSSRGTSQRTELVTTPSNQVDSSEVASTSVSGEQSSGLSITTSQMSSTAIESSAVSSTSGIQTMMQTDGSAPSGFQVPILLEVVYGESYSITYNGQTIGTFMVSGGMGLYSSNSPNTLNIEIDPDIVLQDGDIVTLFSVPLGELLQLDGLVFAGESCLSGEGQQVFNEETNQNDYQLILNLESVSCTQLGDASKFGAIPLLTSGVWVGSI